MPLSLWVIIEPLSVWVDGLSKRTNICGLLMALQVFCLPPTHILCFVWIDAAPVCALQSDERKNLLRKQTLTYFCAPFYIILFWFTHCRYSSMITVRIVVYVILTLYVVVWPLIDYHLLRFTSHLLIHTSFVLRYCLCHVRILECLYLCHVRIIECLCLCHVRILECLCLCHVRISC